MTGFDCDLLQDYLVAVCLATEVPPAGTENAGPRVELEAVIDVIRNRARLWSLKPVQVVMEPRQFSAVCREQYWRQALAGQWFPGWVEECFDAWRSRFRTNEPDITDGATHYYSPIGMVPEGRRPSWSLDMIEVEIPGVRAEFFRFFKRGG